MTDEERSQVLGRLGEQRWKDYKSGIPEITEEVPGELRASVPEGLDPITSDFFEFYAMKRGHHSNAPAAFTLTSSMAFMNFPHLNDIETISPSSILFIIGENAHSRYFTKDTYKMAAALKELHIVPGTRHIDLHDRTDMIPFDKLTKFFTRASE